MLSNICAVILAEKNLKQKSQTELFIKLHFTLKESQSNKMINEIKMSLCVSLFVSIRVQNGGI